MGLMIATVGIDLQSGAARFTFGSPDLLDGIHLLTAIIGVYAITEVLVTVEQLSCGTFRTAETVGRMWASQAEWLRRRMGLVRGTLIGSFVGLRHGRGGAVGTPLRYGTRLRGGQTPRGI